MRNCLQALVEQENARSRDYEFRDNQVVRFYRVQVLRQVPHRGRGFTQGLISDGNVVWESTGLYGQSALLRYALDASETELISAALPGDLFGEGICRVGGSLWQLTWKERVALRWDAVTMELRETVRYNRDGWGICAAGGKVVAGTEATSGGKDATAGEVVTSDGTSELVRRDPVTLEPRAVVHARYRNSRVRGLNDMTWDGSRIWANVAGTACLAGIDLDTGEVTAIVDARAAAERHLGDSQAIMNGIAALPHRGDESVPGEFLLTGKTWRRIRQVRLVPDRDRGHTERLLSGSSR